MVVGWMNCLVLFWCWWVVGGVVDLLDYWVDEIGWVGCFCCDVGFVWFGDWGVCFGNWVVMDVCWNIFVLGVLF